MKHSEEYWWTTLKSRGAIWTHNGDPKRPHALLTSDAHSDGFVNASKVINDPILLGEICTELRALAWPNGFQDVRVLPDVVIGPAVGAITLAYEMAAQLGCETAFTERVDGMMKLKRFGHLAGRALIFEDVLTTGGTTRETITAVEQAGLEVMPFTLCLVNRSALTELDGRSIIPLLHLPMNTWKEEECLLCAEGSQALRPKENWSKLVAA